MSHDKKGTKLKIGDRVVIPGVVTGLAPTDEYHNVAIDLEHPMPPENTTTTLLNINTRQVIKADDQEPLPPRSQPVPTAAEAKTAKTAKPAGETSKGEKVKFDGD